MCVVPLATGDLAGVGKKYDAAIELQQRMVFPRPAQGRGGAAASTSKATTTVTVTPKSGTAVSESLVELNDSGRCAIVGAIGVRAEPGVTVQKNDPLAAHREMLDTLTDKNIHDLVAYLETLQVKRLLLVCLAAACAARHRACANACRCRQDPQPRHRLVAWYNGNYTGRRSAR